MKNFFKARIAPLFGIIAMVAVIGFSMASCKHDGNGGAKYTQAQYHSYSSNIILGQAPSGSGDQWDNFEVNLANSTLPGFTTSGNPRTNSSDSCGFSVTVNGSARTIISVNLSSMFEDYNIVLIIDDYSAGANITSSDTIKVDYTPDGTHVFKNYNGEELEGFSLTATYNAN